MNILQNSELYTRKEAAAFLRICITSFDRLRLSSVRLGRRVFYRKETLIACIADNEKPKQAYTGRVV
jgi:hypothetical protein